jgi:hemolysin III
MNKKEKAIPIYSRGEEIFNRSSHLVGAVIFFFVLILFATLSIINNLSALETASLVFYSLCMILMYTNSTIYHAVKPDSRLKRIARIIDHNSIYFAIAGTYTPVCAIGLKDLFPINIIIFSIEIAGLILGCILSSTSINFKVARYITIILYVIMGWLVIIFFPAVLALPLDTFIYLLIGGIMYTVGVIFYAIGKKKKWMHSVFHLFILAGSIFQLVSLLSLIVF